VIPCWDWPGRRRPGRCAARLHRQREWHDYRSQHGARLGKDSNDGSIHDKDTFYTWGNAFAVKLAALNTPPCFAGACDWRLPNRRELESIIDLEQADPCVPPAFNTGCLPGCPVSACSCTTPTYVWSSTSVALQPISAWVVHFLAGGENFGFNKTSSTALVRAVRGGS
jgi:hypothetical protein